MHKALFKFTLLGCLTLGAACSSSGARDGDDHECAEPGHYVVTAERSADPGDCPLEDVPIEWNDVELESKACGGTTIEVSGSYDATGGVHCSYSGEIELSAVASDEVHGEATLDFGSCTVLDGGNCAARYDLVYRLQAPGEGT